MPPVRNSAGCVTSIVSPSPHSNFLTWFHWAHFTDGDTEAKPDSWFGQILSLPLEDPGCETLLVWCKSLLVHIRAPRIQNWRNKISTQMLEGFAKTGRTTRACPTLWSYLGMELLLNFWLACSQKVPKAGDWVINLLNKVPYWQMGSQDGTRSG